MLWFIAIFIFIGFFNQFMGNINTNKFGKSTLLRHKNSPAFSATKIHKGILMSI